MLPERKENIEAFRKSLQEVDSHMAMKPSGLFTGEAITALAEAADATTTSLKDLSINLGAVAGRITQQIEKSVQDSIESQEKFSVSSGRATTALNTLTFVLVVISALALSWDVLKWFLSKS